MNMNILGKRYVFFALSLLLIIPGLVVLAIYKLPLSIDFKGGTLVEVQFTSGTIPSTEAVKAIYEKYNVMDSQITSSGADTIIVKSSTISESDQNKILADLTSQFGEINLNRSETVGPSISQQVSRQAALAVGFAALGVVIYIWLVFRKIPNSLRYGICAIIAMVHDFLIVISLTAIAGRFFGWQVDALFLTALLTVIGFSVQDKIVVFDRIRENTSIFRRLPYEKLVNHSIIQTLQRSINTQLMTSEFMLLALALFGGVTLREFAVILLVGFFSGTYSSIFIAAPILVVWESKEWKTWFKRNKPLSA
jgi:preprotein translocase subunit SecF